MFNKNNYDLHINEYFHDREHPIFFILNDVRNDVSDVSIDFKH